MISFEEYKRTVADPKEFELFRQYEEYRKQCKEEERKENEALAVAKEKTAAFRFEFLKYFISSIVIGGFTVWTTYVFKEYELRLQTRQQDSQTIEPYVSKFLVLMDADSSYTKVHDMCEFLSYTIIEDSLKCGFIKLRDIYGANIHKATKAFITTADSSKYYSKRVDSLNVAMQALKDAKADSKKIDEIKAKIIISKISANEFSAKKSEALLVAKQKLENTAELDLPVSSDPVSYNVIYEEDRYTGDDYFSEMTENYSIYMDDVTDLAVKYRIKGADNKDIKTVTQNIGETIVTDDGNYRITVLLTGIKKKRIAYYNIKIEKKIEKK